MSFHKISILRTSIKFVGLALFEEPNERFIDF